KLPLRSPVNKTLPAVGVNAAYIGAGVLMRHAILPLFGSTALIQPFHLSIGSLVPQPFERPVYGIVAIHFESGPSLNTEHQSIALTYNSPVIGIRSQLIPPFQLARPRVERDCRNREQIRAGSHLVVVIGPRVADWNEQRAGFAIKRVRHPRRSAAMILRCRVRPRVGAGIAG